MSAKSSKSKIIDKAADKAKNSSLKKDTINQEDIIFALDIGTRTVIGIVGVQEKDKFKVIASEIVEHKSRSMLDGQIHDIEGVALVVKEVRERLEKKLGMSLSKVAIAAAGRVLKTCQVHVERECDSTKEIDLELVSSLELEGIQRAQAVFDDEISKEERTRFYCVGYSVVNYYLDDYVISALAGHRGKKVGADILATFLPHAVIDSMYTVMNRVGLEVVSLTLEPIAAINVAIPKDLRLLNLALVDIGAGTSDMAITRDGSIIAYGMIPIAGDEITEKIAHHYLVDFNTAEKIKILLSEKKDKIAFTDVLGIKRTVETAEVMEVIKPAVELLAQTVAEKILEYNHKAPNAVFLVGGGSQIPCLTELIASKLGLTDDRVVVRRKEFFSKVKVSSKKLAGPDAITPIGIAVTSQMQRGHDFISVAINGQKVRLFNSKKLVVADALVLIGFNPRDLIGKNGKNIDFELNGVRKTVMGETGNSAQIFVNDKPANLETVLNNGDDIKILPAVDGADAKIKASELVKDISVRRICLNGAQITLEPKIFINGKSADINENIQNGDIVNIEEIITMGDLIKVCEIDPSEFDIKVNGTEVPQDYILKDSDEVEYISKKFKKIDVDYNIDINNNDNNDDYYIEDEIETAENNESDSNYGNMDSYAEEAKPRDVLTGENCLNIIVNGENMSIKNNNDSKFIFVDIFNYIDFDLSKPKGNIVLKLNGKNAAFTDIVNSGDVIDIYWDKN
ncbi:cell division FtsA domain-containing protein [Acetivibrio clariflavus]|uniref:Actin-like ATPase involved in cell division n=1 Tax=Acetivibrio clariflavus (strain DSM 19732 / NBRC 101661 / EBR45) TaxID=720554 RepID=G8LXT8_ACECE|nr:cell division FtsA domain-containing protein [Acetivibrio clariflavus]AEV68841.1 actin-like ATPase involved in cell division [Acetivibrio clariflavus DSM 19732]